jgi:Zn-dependent alcohol dehydrogenase
MNVNWIKGAALLLLLMGGVSLHAQAALNEQVRFQGRLTNPGGTPITTATNVQFRIYTQPTGGGVEYSFEAIGLKVTAEQAFGMLKNGGTATVIGMIPIGQKVELPGVDFLFENKIQGSNMGSNASRVDMPRYVDLYLQGRLNLDDLVSKRIKLDQVNDAFADLTKGTVARSVIQFE